MIRFLALALLALTTCGYYLEVEDTVGKREAVVWGVLKVIHYHQDQKEALILEGALLEHRRGEPTLTLDEIDIMHPIDSHLHRFEPEHMKPIDLKNTKDQMEMLAYISRKDPRWHYRFHISPQLTQEIEIIRGFMGRHHVQEPLDLFENVPEELKEELLRQHQEALKQVDINIQEKGESPFSDF